MDFNEKKSDPFEHWVHTAGGADPVVEPIVESAPLPKPIEPKEQKPEPSKNEKMPVTANDAGLLMGKSFDEQYRIARLFAASEMVPKNYRNRPDNVLAAWQTAIELGLKPYSALRQIAVINGTPSLWGELPLSLCMKSGNFVSIDEFLVDEKYKKISFENQNLREKPFASICIVERKNPFRRVEHYFSTDDAQRAGLLSKDIWKNYPKRMLQMRARSLALKDCFPDILSGVAQAEYDFDLIPNESGVYEVEKTKSGFASTLTGVVNETKETAETAERDCIQPLPDLQESEIRSMPHQNVQDNNVGHGLEHDSNVQTAPSDAAPVGVGKISDEIPNSEIPVGTKGVGVRKGSRKTISVSQTIEG